MSISNALLTSLSGLQASSRVAETISNNVANAMTPGYHRQTVELASQVLDGSGAGVRVASLTRAENAVATLDRRKAEAEMGYTSSRAAALERMTGKIGLPGNGDAIAERFAALETALTASGNQPDSETVLSDTVGKAAAVATSINDAAREIQAIRTDADADIALMVKQINQATEEIAKINVEISQRYFGGSDNIGLIDQRDALIDKIAEFVPIRVIPRQNDTVAVYTIHGGALVDGLPHELEFTQTDVVTSSDSLATGELSPLRVKGRNVEFGTDVGLFDGGRLEAAFEIRDKLAPHLATQLDGLARDLIERFEDPAVDPTLAAGAAGLFTDAGNPLDPADLVGLSERISLNSAVDPNKGGELWRLRDGIGATAVGSLGNVLILRNMETAMSTARTPNADMALTAVDSAFGFASEISDNISFLSSIEADKVSYSVGHLSALKEEELSSTGVDTDTELQSLLLVEKAYTANAKVMQVVDNLIARLMEI